MTQGNAGHNLSVKLQYAIQNHFTTLPSVCLAITTMHTALCVKPWSEYFLRIILHVHVLTDYKTLAASLPYFYHLNEEKTCWYLFLCSNFK